MVDEADGVTPTEGGASLNLTLRDGALGTMRRMDGPGANRGGCTRGCVLDAGKGKGAALLILLVLMDLKGTYVNSLGALLFMPCNKFLLNEPLGALGPPTCN
jgi:hypothetical protein